MPSSGKETASKDDDGRNKMLTYGGFDLDVMGGWLPVLKKGRLTTGVIIIQEDING